MAEKLVSRAQLSRMLRLLVDLRAGRFPNADELARSGEVSRRTVFRDLEALVEAGVPCATARTGAGTTWGRGFFLPPVMLEESEALALAARAFAPATGEPAADAAEARRAMRKVVAGLPDPTRARVALAIANLEAEERPSPRNPRDGQREVDSGDLPIRMGLAVNERAHSSVG